MGTEEEIKKQGSCLGGSLALFPPACPGRLSLAALLARLFCRHGLGFVFRMAVHSRSPAIPDRYETLLPGGTRAQDQLGCAARRPLSSGLPKAKPNEVARKLATIDVDS